MFAVYASGISADDPLSVLSVGEIDAPETPEDWVTVNVKAASLNHHDLWALRGTALTADQVPMILGTDAAGITEDGREVIVHGVIGDPAKGGGDETLDPKRSLLSEVYPGALAAQVRVPARNLIDKPAELTWEEAACLPTAWLTAYRMLVTKSGAKPGDLVLVQGAAGGVASAAIVLAKALGLRVWATSRDEAKREWARSLGADEVFESGARLPGKVDAVIDSVGEATWSHSLRALRPGGAIITCGATSGGGANADLNRVFFLQLRIEGSTMGTAEELKGLVALLVQSGARPVIDRVLPMEQAAAGLAAMHAGELRGKIVLTLP
ncbi:MAG: zinc-binding dehydrogenase [Candidatus Nanopelagicales bacterium]|nr:zinc-binding dehydrogenase [Candidatus Nanopelagicales bacterium]